MNQTKNLNTNQIRKSKLIYAYLKAKSSVISNGFEDEIIWQENICFSNLDEQCLLKEVAWVILNSGMRERVIRNSFSRLTEIFFNWKCAKLIVDNKDDCFSNSLEVFNHEKKIRAIIHSAELIQNFGVSKIRNMISTEGVNCLQMFPYIGPITSYHLAKNIGIEVAKADRHLQRIANVSGYFCVQQLCSEIANSLQEKISVVDLVIWRYATIEPNYLSLFDIRCTQKSSQFNFPENNLSSDNLMEITV